MLDRICLILVIIGALNWGFIGFLGVDLVALLFGAGSWLSMLVYDIVGLSAVWCAIAYMGRKRSK